METPETHNENTRRPEGVRSARPRRMRVKVRYRWDRIAMLLAVPVTIILLVLWLIFGKSCSGSDSRERVDETLVWSDTVSNASSALPSLKRMDREVDRFRRRWGLAGLSLAVTRNDSLVYAKGYGHADRDSLLPMDASTTMRIASVSKLITAVAVMHLVDKGILGLDSRVFGPEGIIRDTLIANAVTDKRVFDITVDHLLQHSAGFSQRAGDPMFTTADIVSNNDLSTAPTPDELMRIVLRRRLGAAPGSWRSYSNFGYFVLSQVVEHATGIPYYTYVTDSVLTPMGAFKTRPAGNYRHQRHDDEAVYYGPDTVKIPEFNGSGRMVDRVYGGNNIHGLYGAGGWTSTPADLARIVAGIDGNGGLEDFLSPRAIALMTEARDDGPNLARGWSDTDVYGKWTRTGTLASTHALVIRYPQGDTWVVTTNSGYYSGHQFLAKVKELVAQLRRGYLTSIPHRTMW